MDIEKTKRFTISAVDSFLLIVFTDEIRSARNAITHIILLRKRSIRIGIVSIAVQQMRQRHITALITDGDFV